MTGCRLLVTGACGFVGRHLVELLRTTSERYEVWTTDIRPAPSDKHIRADLQRQDEVERLIAEVRPERVVHLAGTVGGTDLEEQMRINCLATGSLYQALVERCDLDRLRLVQAGSASLYGWLTRDDLPVTEDQPARPLSAYGLSKAAQDQLAWQYWMVHRLPVVRARLFNLIGPGQPAGLVPMTFVRQTAQVALGRADTIRVGNLDARRDYVDVRDVLSAVLLLLEQGSPGEAYNVGSGVDVSIGGLLERLFALAAVRPRCEVAQERLRPADVPAVRSSPARLMETTGWRPERSLDDSLTGMWREELAAAAAGGGEEA